MSQQRSAFWATACAASIVSAAALTACGGGSTATTPLAPAAATTLATAMNTVCVTPSTSSQVVSLPATGGVSGTLTFGAYPAGATGCDNVTIATGSDIVTADALERKAQSAVPEASATGATPILTITVGEAFTNSGPVSGFGYQSIVSGMQLTAAPNLNFPNGTYYATVTVAGITSIIPLTANNGVLTVSSGAEGLPAIILANSSATISLFKLGVMPSPSPSASASASATASASPNVAVSGAPVPDGTVIGSATYTVEYEPNNTNGTMSTSSIVYESTSPTYNVSVVNGYIEPGITTYTLSGLNAESYRVDGCTGQIQYSGKGSQGVFTVPLPSTAFTVADSCNIDFFSVPAAVVNAAPNYGFGYDIFTITTPVTQEMPPYGPALDL